MQVDGLFDSLAEVDWGGIASGVAEGASTLANVYAQKLKLQAQQMAQQAQLTQLQQMMAAQNGYVAPQQAVYPQTVGIPAARTPALVASSNLPSWLMPVAAVGAALLILKTRS